MHSYPGGVWPVMLTPYTKTGALDTEGLAALTDWYIKSGVSGLFSSCQSSEILYLTPEERVLHARVTMEAARGRVPVVASGHVSDDMDEQVRELEAMAETGVDAVILITNHLAKPDEADGVWIKNCETLVKRLDGSIRLGLYECPLPYKRLMSKETLKFCADTGRFYFLKDTCCDARTIAERLEVLRNGALALYNANTTTLLASLREGAAGFSGVMAGFHPELYVWLTAHPYHQNAQAVQDLLSVCSLIERQLYPVNAKYHLKAVERLPIETISRACDDAQLSETFKAEVHMMDRLCRDGYARYCR